MLENIVGKRYANALSDALKDDSRLRPALQNLKAVCHAFQIEPQLAQFFAHPGIPPESKIGAVRELCDRLEVEKEIRNLLTMLVERKKILYLKNIAENFELEVDKRLNQIRVGIVSVCPLTQQNVEKLKSSLKRITGKDVLIETSIDDSLIAGVILRIGDLVADATAKNRLAILKRYIEKEEAV